MSNEKTEKQDPRERVTKLPDKVEKQPVMLTRDELLEFGQRLAQQETAASEHASHADAVKKELKSRETAIEAERSRLAGIVRKKAELRDVRIGCWKHHGNRTYVEVREDTGEVIFSRPLRPDELQDELFDPEDTNPEKET